ncbi:hypothetical protein KAI32_02960 [Candidatus Pacearchaeota archaeon]|nr:hypothetical protein [Candidatus Pacearchaeota archaeon]
MSNTVWQFTNQRKLSKKEFLDYFERKVFRTIRKHQMLPSDKIIILKPSSNINTKVLKAVLGKKFQVKFTSKPNLSSDNLSQLSEDIFKNILQGNFTSPNLTNKPLQFLSDKEIELYAKLTNLKGSKRKQNKKIQTLFEKFLKKNQDLELNIVKAARQIKIRVMSLPQPIIFFNL